MDFGLTDEQRAVVATTRAFVERELYPHEEEVERTGALRPELRDQIREKAIKGGLYAANMPEEAGGAGLDTVTWVLYEKELGKASYALQYTVGRPSNILLGGTEAQKERYLYPCIRGERVDCMAMTEPGAGSDLRGMRTRAVRQEQDGRADRTFALGVNVAAVRPADVLGVVEAVVGEVPPLVVITAAAAEAGDQETAAERPQGGQAGHAEERGRNVEPVNGLEAIVRVGIDTAVFADAGVGVHGGAVVQLPPAVEADEEDGRGDDAAKPQ